MTKHIYFSAFLCLMRNSQNRMTVNNRLFLPCVNSCKTTPFSLCVVIFRLASSFIQHRNKPPSRLKFSLVLLALLLASFASFLSSRGSIEDCSDRSLAIRCLYMSLSPTPKPSQRLISHKWVSDQQRRAQKMASLTNEKRGGLA